MMSDTMHEDFQALLEDDAATAGLVGDRITWGLLPQGTQNPAIALHEISATPQYTMNGQDGLLPTRVQVDCRGTSFASAMAVARKVRAVLSGYKGTKGATTFAAIFQLGGRSSSGRTDAEVFHTVSTDFECWSKPA